MRARVNKQEKTFKNSACVRACVRVAMPHNSPASGAHERPRPAFRPTASELAGRRHKAGYRCCPTRKTGRIFQALRHAAGGKGTGMPFATALTGLQAASGLKAGGRVGWGQKNALRRFWRVMGIAGARAKRAERGCGSCPPGTQGCSSDAPRIPGYREHGLV